MDTRSFIMKQRSRRLAVRSRRRREQLREMEEEHESEQARQRELRIQKQNIQTDSTIQDLEDMVMRDLSYNVPVEYYEQPLSGSRIHPYKNGIKKTKHTFDIIKEQRINSLLPIKKQKMYHTYTFSPHVTRGGHPLWDRTPLINMVPNPSIAETSDKFVAILNIVKQQDARIKELEEELSGRISCLEEDWRDRMDEVYEAKLRGNTKRFSKS